MRYSIIAFVVLLGLAGTALAQEVPVDQTAPAPGTSAEQPLVPGTDVEQAPVPGTSEEQVPVPAAAVEQAVIPVVIHWEIMSSDAASARNFYQTLFGWQPFVSPENPDYTPVTTTGPQYSISGGIGQIQNAAYPPYLTNYVQVSDLDQRVAQVPVLGGMVVVEPMAIPGIGRFAMFIDPGGTMMGMLEMAEMDAPIPPQPPAQYPVVSWEMM